MNELDKCYCTEYIEKEDMSKLTLENEIYSIYGKLNIGEKILVKYHGKLVSSEDGNNKKIYINYGYGNSWQYKNVCEMKLCEYSDKPCYCIELELLNVENLFFCFMDNNNCWDLNDNSSYFITISECINTLTKKTVEMTVPDEEYMSAPAKFFQNLTNKLINFFARIGSLFDKKVKM